MREEQLVNVKFPFRLCSKCVVRLKRFRLIPYVLQLTVLLHVTSTFRWKTVQTILVILSNVARL